MGIRHMVQPSISWLHVCVLPLMVEVHYYTKLRLSLVFIQICVMIQRRAKTEEQQEKREKRGKWGKWEKRDSFKSSSTKQ